MEYKKIGKKIYLRLDKNDEVISSITEVCTKENIKTASVSGIGGCGEVITGTYFLDKQDYEIQEKTGLFEMISLTGNVTLHNNEPFAHLHAMFSYIDSNGCTQLIGGHLKKAVILLTGEIVIDSDDIVISRRKDSDLGINVWNFS